MANEEAVLKRLRNDTPWYAEKFLRIVNKDAQNVPLKPSAGQLALDEILEQQRSEGKPMRALVLKARQVGISTWVQAKMIHRCTLRENQNAIVVAHDVETGNKLFRMGQTMYGALPDDELVKPGIRAHRRGRFMHFAPPGADAWKSGDLYPNSTYFVDTAGEFQAGRGGTYQLAHLSEFAFWERPLEKLTALLAGVPRANPETMVIIESTANGMGPFKDLWDDAVEGRSAWAPFFWPWWKEESYSLPFANEQEKEDFKRELGQGELGEDEPELIKLGLTLEQLHWRRQTISTEFVGRIDVFHQEYPATPEEAFISTGRHVFSPAVIKKVLAGTDETDPRRPDQERSGPNLGSFECPAKEKVIGRGGYELERPTRALWMPKGDSLRRDPWKLWTPLDDERQPVANSQYVVGVDVSGGEMSEESTEPAFHAIQVIDHKTREQVAEYRSHVDPDQIAELVYLAARFIFNNAWVAVEITGGWGLPVVRRLFLDWHYPFVYIRKQHQSTTEDQSKMIGWHTTQATKPIIEANMAEMFRDGSHGVKSRTLALEALTYVRDEKGKTGPEAGRFSDLLIAYMIAQQVANEYPMRMKSGGTPTPVYRQRDPVTGY